MFRLSALALLVVSALPSGAYAQYQNQVRAQLLQAAEIFMADGYTIAAESYYDTLRNSETDTLTLTMNSGYDYKVVGVCDNDCDDLDLTVDLRNGNEVSDVLTDSIPILTFQVPRDGTYDLNVRMYSCNVNPCHYGVMMLRR